MARSGVIGDSLPIVENRRSPGAQGMKQVRARKPRGSRVPNTPRVAALEKDVSGSFRLSLTQLTLRVVRPTPEGKAIRSPKPILHGKPGKEAAFWGSPGFPDQLVEGAWN